MNKLIYTLYTTLIATILLSALPVHGMEDQKQSILQTKELDNSEYPLPNFKLEDELIFACCQVPELIAKKSAAELKKALVDTIKNFMKLCISCKKYNQLLTFEIIGNFCKNYSSFAKNQIVRDLYPRLGSSDISSKEYHLYRPLILILIHANANFKNREHCLPQFAIKYSDAYMLETLFKHQMINPNISEGNSGVPFFFYAKTVEIAQIFIDHGADIHATPGNPTYNVLTHIKGHVEYPSELRKFYLNHGVKVLRLQ